MNVYKLQLHGIYQHIILPFHKCIYQVKLHFIHYNYMFHTAILKWSNATTTCEVEVGGVYPQGAA